MSAEIHEFPAEAGRMLNDLGPLLGGKVVCAVVFVDGEIHMMYPEHMPPQTIEALEDAMIAIALSQPSL